MGNEPERPKIDLRRSRLARQAIRETLTNAARKRNSLSLRIDNGHIRQSLTAHERLRNGDTFVVTVDYDGAIISEETRHVLTGQGEFSSKPLGKKPLSNTSFYMRNIIDIWHRGPSNYYPRDAYRPNKDDDDYDHYYDQFEYHKIEPWEVPDHSIKVFRASYDKLLVACCDSYALQTTMMARRKKIRVSEIETADPRGLHTIDEIINHSLIEASRQKNPKYTEMANFGLRRLEKILDSEREFIL